MEANKHKRSNFKRNSSIRREVANPKVEEDEPSMVCVECKPDGREIDLFCNECNGESEVTENMRSVITEEEENCQQMKYSTDMPWYKVDNCESSSCQSFEFMRAREKENELKNC